MSSIRHPIFHNSGGVPVMSQGRSASCIISIFSLKMYKAGTSCGWRLPSRRCSVVSIAMMPQDQD
jgi:hypothetical protein